ncbi:conserved hypothetical protein [Ricinus communis]|uniref:Peptidase S8/S53 domain-containing protein n=1 Tax=Ricinus communis TaxID=3988 RepID=B9TBT8_RICCO|nr:conserved hypothetical protein [Ricinus communis]
MNYRRTNNRNDTGANIGHPLLAPFITARDQFVIESSWTPADDNGHGTGMCGLAAWGDLTHALSSSDTVSIYHRLESVKLLRQPGDNGGRHYGNITFDAVSLVEIDFPERTRVFALAVSATDGRDRGRPSAWSSSVDSLTSDYLGENENPRLMIISAGNTGHDLTALKDYPDYNVVQQLHDPAQAWNALTVGAATFKTTIAEAGTSGFVPLAPSGGLSPYSTTSVSWDRKMPIKPEVVFEGGNAAKDTLSCLGFASLHLLTTHHEFNSRHFSTFNATSAATALAAKFAAEIYAEYPNLWPETVRALIVHSAKWTDALHQQFPHGTTARQKAQRLVRVAGYGVPDMKSALWSLKNSLSLIIEDELQPFEKIRGKEPSTRDMHLHDIPWPKESLLALGEVEVTMTVTLSYFIEPNPSSRNVSGKYSYPSHQLRFDVKRPNESSRQFQRRISRAVHDLEEGAAVITGTDSDWLLGDYRHKGSVHKDVWSGTAAELAERGQIIIYPAMGWWRTRTKLERTNKRARYSLVVSISTPTADVDLYSEIATKLELSSKVATEVTAT